MTGGTGFLGSRLLPMLLKDGCEVTLLKRSFSSMERIKSIIGSIDTFDIDKIPFEQIFEKSAYDIILHCATNYGRRVPDSEGILETNLMLPVRLIELGAKNHVRCFVNTDTCLDKQASQYALSKHQFKDWLRLYAERISCVNIALEYFYGPGDDDTKFVSSIIRKLIANEPSIDLTLGEQRRDFIYIDDIVDAYKTILSDGLASLKGYSGFEVGSGRQISIKDLVLLMARLVDNESTSLRFGALAYRPNEVMQSNVDIDALSKLGWECRVSLVDGLARTISFERDQ
jgi:nucleoside-diphosphate-sugar epimerase